MNNKTIYILFGILAAILLLVGLTWWFEPAYEETSKFLLPSANGKDGLKPEDVTKVRIERARPDAETLVFEHDSATDAWKITSPRALPANSSNIKELVRQLLTAEAAPRTDVPADLKAAELDPPAEVVTLTTKGNKEIKVNVGGETPLGTGAVVYLTSTDKPSAPTPVLKSSVASAFKKVSFFRNPYLLASSTSDYKAVTLSLNKAEKKEESKGPLTLKKKEEGLWQYTNPQGYDGSAEQGQTGVRLEAGKETEAGVEGLLKVLSDLQVAPPTDDQDDFVADEATDLGQYNLDAAKSDVIAIDVDRVESIGKDENGAPKTQTSSVKALIGVGKKLEEKDKPAKYYAAVKGDKGWSVVKVAATGPDAVALLFKDPAYLCNHNLTALAGKAPLAVDVVNADGVLSFRREGVGKDWQVYRNNAKDETPADQTAVGALVNQLVQPGQVRSFLDAKSDVEKLGLAKPVATVSIWVDGVVKEEEPKPPEKKDGKDADKKDENKDEKKEEKKPRLILAADKVDKPAARLIFGAVDGDQVAVKREANHTLPDGDKTTVWAESALVKAPKLLADQALAGPLTYYDKTLPSYNAKFDLPDKDVLKLTLDRADGEHYVISRADPAKPEWKFEEPKEMADRKVDASAVDGALAALAGLRATSLVAEAPKDDDLDKLYGLKTPTLTAAVTKKDDKNSPYIYKFGKDTADGAGVYAQQSQRPVVFVVSKVTLDSLKRDLRDRTIFAFDPAKVKTVKMSGWQKKTGGQVLKRELERRDEKTWAVKDPPDLPMSSDKVGKFVADLSKLTAERFVTRNAVIKTEYDKEKPKSVFTVTMKVEGVDAEYVLEVVDLTGDQTLPEADRQVYATSPQAAGELFQVRRTLFTAPPGMPTQIGPIDEAGYFSP